jgi:hypothetical protein
VLKLLVKDDTIRFINLSSSVVFFVGFKNNYTVEDFFFVNILKINFLNLMRMHRNAYEADRKLSKVNFLSASKVRKLSALAKVNIKPHRHSVLVI